MWISGRSGRWPASWTDPAASSRWDYAIFCKGSYELKIINGWHLRITTSDAHCLRVFHNKRDLHPQVSGLVTHVCRLYWGIVWRWLATYAHMLSPSRIFPRTRRVVCPLSLSIFCARVHFFYPAIGICMSLTAGWAQFWDYCYCQFIWVWYGSWWAVILGSRSIFRVNWRAMSWIYFLRSQ